MKPFLRNCAWTTKTNETLSQRLTWFKTRHSYACIHATIQYFCTFSVSYLVVSCSRFRFFKFSPGREVKYDILYICMTSCTSKQLIDNRILSTPVTHLYRMNLSHKSQLLRIRSFTSCRTILSGLSQ